MSIIVPVWNGQDTVSSCIQFLTQQTFPRSLIVDNDSTDASADIVREFTDVLLLMEAVPGPYRARNLGLDHATGDLIAVTDADCEAAPNWIAEGCGRSRRMIISPSLPGAFS